MSSESRPIEINVISFAVVVNKEKRELGLLVSGETSLGDRLVTMKWDFALVHEMCGRLLGGMVQIDRRATLEALKAVLSANEED